MNTNKFQWVILIGIVVIIGIMIWTNFVEKETVYPQRDSVLQGKVDSLLELVQTLDTAIQTNNYLIANNEGEIKNIYINQKQKTNEILHNPLDSSRIANLRNYLKSRFLARQRETGLDMP